MVRQFLNPKSAASVTNNLGFEGGSISKGGSDEPIEPRKNQSNTPCVRPVQNVVQENKTSIFCG